MRKTITGIMLALVSIATSAQSFCGGTTIDLQFGISDRWTAHGFLSANYSDISAKCLFGETGLGASFSVANGVKIFTEGSFHDAKYHELFNRDQIWQLTEGVNIDTKHQFTHTLRIDERRLTFRPTKHEITCSRISYEAAKIIDINETWGIKVGARITTNIKSEISQSPFVQRIVGSAEISRSMGKQSKIHLRYEYMSGSKKQTYMNEGDNLHRINLTFELTK